MTDLVRFPLDDAVDLHEGNHVLRGRAVELALAVGPAGTLADARLRLRAIADDVTDVTGVVGPAGGNTADDVTVTLRLVDHRRADAPTNAVAFRRRLRGHDVLSELSSWAIVDVEPEH